MRLYIKQHVFSWKEKFDVTDDDGRMIYRVSGELFSWGHKLHIENRRGREVAEIREKHFTWTPRYQVCVHDRQVAEIVKEITFLRPKYHIEGPDWEIDGSLWEHDYRIKSGWHTVADIHKQWMSWGDCYELDIDPGEDELMALAVVLAIDCITADEEKASAAFADE